MAKTSFEELIEKKKRGSLKVYLGYAAGTGKTYEMLQEGHRLSKRGLEVAIGYVEPHNRPETIALTEGLKQIPRRMFLIGGQNFPEMDVPEILKRRPQVVLVDELAHANMRGAKHEKRYEDVLEILDSGINVISTLNVQHLESVADRVEQVTQAPVQERLPDWVLRRADQIVIVDVSMEELRERLTSGKIYEKAKAEIALQRFFTYENLSFLREMGLREVAGDQVRKIEEQELLNKGASDLAEEAVMVALSSDPTHAEILIRKATRMANQLSTRCYVVYIQKSKESPIQIDSSLQRRLQNNLKLAKILDAEVVMIQNENIVEALVAFASSHHVKHAIFGKSRRSLLIERLFGSLVLEFIHDSVGIDVHIVTTTGEATEGLRIHDFSSNLARSKGTWDGFNKSSQGSVMKVGASLFVFIYLCLLSGFTFGDPIFSPPVECFSMVDLVGTRITLKQKLTLCAGATVDAPARCFAPAMREGMTVDQGVSLCQGALSDAPYRCFLNSLNRGLSMDQRVKLCGTASSANPNQCFDSSIDLGLTLDQRVLLCANSSSDETLRCFFNASNLGITLDQRVRLCTQITSSGSQS